jgi:hypothetical protein
MNGTAETHAFTGSIGKIGYYLQGTKYGSEDNCFQFDALTAYLA